MAEAMQRARIRELEETVSALKMELELIRASQNRGEVLPIKPPAMDPHIGSDKNQKSASFEIGDSRLDSNAIERYSRQLLLADGFGVTGQGSLARSSVLVIGAGGIGSTALQYLAAAGVGFIRIVDFDVVERSNLHRQIIHSEDTLGMNKAMSARATLERLNPDISIEPINMKFGASNAMELLQSIDCIIDASDNIETRYCINDACVLSNIPLVSGSAIGTQGQMTVYNFKEGACYRCLYPKPAVKSACLSCSDAGVLGPVPGIIGTLQAIETIKILTDWGSAMNDNLLMYDATTCTFTRFRKTPRRQGCDVCGVSPKIRSMRASTQSITEAYAKTESLTPEEAGKKEEEESDNLSCKEYSLLRASEHRHILLDVRAANQFQMCSLPNSINIPLKQIPAELRRIEELSADNVLPIYCICRRGINSAIATQMIRSSTHVRVVKNIVGGLTAWRRDADSSFPSY